MIWHIAGVTLRYGTAIIAVLSYHTVAQLVGVTALVAMVIYDCKLTK